MGYACPVCAAPQPDGGHLANHLAFTALTSGGDHEDWLEDTVPDWGELGEDELAAIVVDHAPEREWPAAGEDAGHDHDDHGHDHGGHEDVENAHEPGEQIDAGQSNGHNDGSTGGDRQPSGSEYAPAGSDHADRASDVAVDGDRVPGASAADVEAVLERARRIAAGETLEDASEEATGEEKSDGMPSTGEPDAETSSDDAAESETE